MSARHALPKDVVEDVAARTGGVPLFVEEVTRLLLERGEQGGIQAIPPTLQQSLMARLDRLGPAREVAQIGSVIGRGFSYGAAPRRRRDGGCAAASRAGEARRGRHRAGAGPAARERLSFQARAHPGRGLRKFAQKPAPGFAPPRCARFCATASPIPPRPSRKLLAHHFTQAGLTDAAIEWWGKAGDQALRRSAFQEAISHLGKAIEMADRAGDGAPGRQPAAGAGGQRLKLQTSYGQAMMWSRGFGSRGNQGRLYVAPKSLPRAVDNAAERFTTYYGLWVGSLLRGESWVGAGDCRDLPARGGERGMDDGSGGRLPLLGLTCLCQGDFVEARAHLEEALRIYDPERDRDAKFRFGTDTGAVAAILPRPRKLAARGGRTGARS